jgi:hypothetical protein
VDYGIPSKDPFGLDKETQERCYAAIYETFRAVNVPLSVEELLRTIVAYFSRSVGAAGVFIRYGSSRSTRLELLHGIQPYMGEPGRSRDRLVTFANLGDIVGTDITTVAFDTAKLAITADVVVPGSIAQIRQLVKEEPIATMMGPFKASEANTCTTKTRAVGYFPFNMVELLIGTDLNVRQVFELVVLALIEAGLEEICTSLVDFLTVDLVAPSVESPEQLTL